MKLSHVYVPLRIPVPRRDYRTPRVLEYGTGVAAAGAAVPAPAAHRRRSTLAAAAARPRQPALPDKAAL